MAAQSLVRHLFWFDSNAGHLAALNQPHTSFSPFVRGGGYLRSRRPEGLNYA